MESDYKIEIAMAEKANSNLFKATLITKVN